MNFEIEKAMEGRIARDQNVAENAMLQIDKIGGNIVKNAKKTFGESEAVSIAQCKGTVFLVITNWSPPLAEYFRSPSQLI